MVEIARLSQEQEYVATAEESCKVQAFAGTGKSTSLIGYAQAHPKETILYLCFNRDNRLQFDSRVKALGLKNTTVNTAHSLAKRFVYGPSNSELTLVGSHSPTLISNLFESELYNVAYHNRIFLIYHSQKMLKSFCSSSIRKIQDFDYQDYTSPDQIYFVNEHYHEIENLTISIMKGMSNLEMPVLHDYYLKLFQVKNYRIPYKTILFDEVQDCSPVMIDIVQNQNTKNIYVGDTHQEIYAWRGAVNAFDYISMPSLFLTESFRFGPNIARVAMHILNWKQELIQHRILGKIIGAGPNSSVKGHAYIARTTVGLLREAIVLVSSNPSIKIRFQGGLQSYLTHELGFTLLDVYDLFRGKPLFDNRRTAFLQEMSFPELVEYAAHTEDNQITSFIKLCTDFPTELPYLIKTLQQAELLAKDKFDPDVTMSTAHRLKGIEFQEVTIADDFLSREALIRMQQRGMTNTKVNEEINLLYVAITRAAKDLNLNSLYLT